MFIDIHCHLDICKDVDDAVKNAREKGVGVIVTNGMSPVINRKAIELVGKYKEVRACIGLYPNDALKMSDDEIENELNFIRKNKDKIIAIGEAGLDLKEDSEETLERQKEILKKQVLLARKLNIPIVIHSRKAELEAIELLEEIGYKKALMHCFMGKLKLVQRIIDNGWYLSIPTNVKSSEHFQRVIEMTPIEQLFCETDSPFLHPDKERWNEPANVLVSYEKIAEIKGLSLKEVEKKIEENYKSLF